MSLEVLSIIEQISREKGIDKEILVDALKSAVEVAARKKLPHIKELHSRFNEETGEVDIYAEKTIVKKKAADPNEEITLKEALKISPDAVEGETILVPQVLENYGRIAAQLAKQVILQKVREAEVDLIHQEFKDKRGQLINGMVSRFEHGDLIVDLGKVEGLMPRREQVFRETFNRGDRIRAYVLDVRKTSRDATVILSRTHVGLIKNLFELEVPEISEGMVDIMGVVREPNGRTKIAVKTNDRDIDAVGACVGMRGMRVQSIVQELRGEKIDIVEHSEDPEMFIRNALSPAKITRIIKNAEENHMTIIVADDQMSLAIGKKGQNVRLAAKLVKWKIDIQGESQSKELFASSILGRSKAPADKDKGVDFLELIKNAKGLGEKITGILFSNDVVTFEVALSKGVEGLKKLPGIGPKKAANIFNLAQTHASASPSSESDIEEDQALVSESEDEVVEPISGETDEEEDELDIPVEQLQNIEPRFIEILKKNGFRTLAELSITSLEELLDIEGMDKETARITIDQAKQHMENFENA